MLCRRLGCASSAATAPSPRGERGRSRGAGLQKEFATSTKRLLIHFHPVDPTKSLLLASLFLTSGNSIAQLVDPEPAAIVELGGAAGWNVKGGSSSGPNLAVEVTPIENWLELEAGITPLFSRHSTEWDTDLLFKKPWTLSEKVEFMFGVGPEWIHTRQHGMTTNSVGGEVALDFMFWPSANHRLGWYLEPAYDYDFGRGHERSLGISGGLLIAIPKMPARITRR
jgi:hypothetical protein